MVDILGVRLPSAANDFIFIYCTQAGSSGARRVERKNEKCKKKNSVTIPATIL
jgi:hypothetical protein